MDKWQLTRDGDVFTLKVNNGENKIGQVALSEWNRALDAVVKTGSDKVLIVTGTDHYWSTGLDLTEVERMSHLESQAFLARVDALLAKILTAPFVTIAALNGHTYAGGGLLALAHDYRVMRSDRGYFCLPSVEVGIPFTAGMAALIADKIPQPAAHDLVISGREIGADEAVAAGIVTRSVPADQVLPVSVEMARGLTGKDAAVLSTVKRRMYHDSVRLLSRST
jgi:enoyl-CoA hydratase/carnithine racemase